MKVALCSCNSRLCLHHTYYTGAEINPGICQSVKYKTWYGQVSLLVQLYIYSDLYQSEFALKFRSNNFWCSSWLSFIEGWNALEVLDHPALANEQVLIPRIPLAICCNWDLLPKSAYFPLTHVLIYDLWLTHDSIATAYCLNHSLSLRGEGWIQVFWMCWDQ